VLPVDCLNSVKLSWIKIQGAGFVVYGFLLYTSSDRTIWSFLHREAGMIELDHLCGRDCAMFVIDEPPRSFVKYAEAYEKKHKSRHPWIEIFREPPERKEQYASHEFSGKLTIDQIKTGNVTDGGIVAIGQGIKIDSAALFDGPAIDPEDIAEVLEFFELHFKQLPCLAWFWDIRSKEHRLLDLQSFENSESLLRYFRSDRFAAEISEARGKHAA
jgi:hypothetical protein